MTALVIIALAAVVLMAIGGLIGAELQDRVHEDSRRRASRQQAVVNARFRAMQRRGEVAELMSTSSAYVLPVALADRPAS